MVVPKDCRERVLHEFHDLIPLDTREQRKHKGLSKNDSLEVVSARTRVTTCAPASSVHFHPLFISSSAVTQDAANIRSSTAPKPSLESSQEILTPPLQRLQPGTPAVSQNATNLRFSTTPQPSLEPLYESHTSPLSPPQPSTLPGTCEVE